MRSGGFADGVLGDVERTAWTACNERAGGIGGSGRVIAAFPGGGIDDASSALPAPRGYGRGVIGDDQVYWPTQHEIFVFDADQVGRAVNGAPVIRKRLRLDTRGAEGGNLVLFKDGLIVAGANRLFVYRQMDRK